MSYGPINVFRLVVVSLLLTVALGGSLSSTQKKKGQKTLDPAVPDPALDYGVKHVQTKEEKDELGQKLLQLFTPLSLAQWKGKARLTRIEKLIDRGADVTTSFDDDGSTAMHLAAFRGKADVVALLDEMYPKLYEVKDYSGRTAMHDAARQGYTDIVIFLDQKHPELYEAKTNDIGIGTWCECPGCTAMHFAAHSGVKCHSWFLFEYWWTHLEKKDATCRGNLEIVAYLDMKHPKLYKIASGSTWGTYGHGSLTAMQMASTVAVAEKEVFMGLRYSWTGSKAVVAYLDVKHPELYKEASPIGKKALNEIWPGIGQGERTPKQLDVVTRVVDRIKRVEANVNTLVKRIVKRTLQTREPTQNLGLATERGGQSLRPLTVTDI